MNYKLRYIERLVYMKRSNIGYKVSNIDLAPVCSTLQFISIKDTNNCSVQ